MKFKFEEEDIISEEIEESINLNLEEIQEKEKNDLSKPIQPKTKKVLKLSDLNNKYQSKIACLIRKKYTNMMKLTKTQQKKFPFFSDSINIRILLNICGIIYTTLISIISIIIYVIGTYYEKDDKEYRTIFIIETLVAVSILIEWIISLALSREKLLYLFSIINILDILTVIPTVIDIISYDINIKLGFLRVLM